MFECIMFALWVWEQRNPIARTIENRDANQLPSICHSSTKKWAQTQVSTSQQSKRDTNMDIIQVFKQLSSSSNQRYIFPVSWVLAMLYRKAVYQRLDRIHITQSHIAMFPNRPRHYFESWKGKKYSENIRRKRRSYFFILHTSYYLYYYMGGGSFGTPQTKSDCVIFVQPLNGLVFFLLKVNEQNISDQVRGKFWKFGLNGWCWQLSRWNA